MGSEIVERWGLGGERGCQWVTVMRELRTFRLFTGILQHDCPVDFVFFVLVLVVWEILARNSHYMNVNNCENVRKTSLHTMEKRLKLLKTELS